MKAQVVAYYGLTPEQLKQVTEAAVSFGNQGVALVLIAGRNNDVGVAETALRQIETANDTLRSGGHEQLSAYFQAQLAKARVIRDRLGGR